MISGIAEPITAFHIPGQGPRGRIRETAASGTNTSSNTMVWDPLARMPVEFQVSSMETPSASKGTAQWMTWGPSGPSTHGTLVMAMSPAGAPLDGALRAEIRNPPSTFVAEP